MICYASAYNLLYKAYHQPCEHLRSRIQHLVIAHLTETEYLEPGVFDVADSAPDTARCHLNVPVLSTPSNDIVSIFHRFSILASRYRIATHATDVTWLQPFPVDFDFFASIHQYPPGELVVRITNNIAALFSFLSPAAVLAHSKVVCDIGIHWSTLCEDTTACAAANKVLIPYLVKLAEVYKTITCRIVLIPNSILYSSETTTV